MFDKTRGAAAAVWSLRVGAKNRETAKLLEAAADFSHVAAKTSQQNLEISRNLVDILDKIADVSKDAATKEQVKKAKKSLEQVIEGVEENLQNDLDTIEGQLQNLGG